MRPFRVLLILAAALGLLAFSGGAGASPDRDIGLLRAAGELDSAQASSQKPKSNQVRVLGHADPGGGFNADVVAHHGFAYMGSWGAFEDEDFDFCPSQGVRVYSLMDPTNPTQVSTFGDEVSEPDLAGTWTEKVIVRHVSTKWFTGDLAAVSIQSCSAEGFTGFGLWDVTDPASPTRLSLYETPNTNGSHELWLQKRGNRAYVWTAIPFSELTTSPDFDPLTGEATIPGEPDFRIIDVSNPEDPVKVGEWGAWAELGVFPGDGQGNEGPGSFVHSAIGSKNGKVAYLSYWDTGTVILDVSDPSSPTFLGRTVYAPDAEGNAHSAWTARGGKLLIQTDEDFDPFPGPDTETGWGYPRFFDISDPASPVELGTFKLPTTTELPPPLGFFSVHDPKVRGSRAYLSWYSEGVVVVSFSDPASPTQIAQFVPPPTSDPQGFFGPFFLGDPSNPPFPFVWGVFVYRGYVLASDINSGLWVVKLK